MGGRKGDRAERGVEGSAATTAATAARQRGPMRLRCVRVRKGGVDLMRCRCMAGCSREGASARVGKVGRSAVGSCTERSRRPTRETAQASQGAQQRTQGPPRAAYRSRPSPLAYLFNSPTRSDVRTETTFSHVREIGEKVMEMANALTFCERLMRTGPYDARLPAMRCAPDGCRETPISNPALGHGETQSPRLPAASCEWRSVDCWRDCSTPYPAGMGERVYAASPVSGVGCRLWSV